MKKSNDYFVMALLGVILFYAFTRFIDSRTSNIAQGVLVFYLLYLLIKNPDQIRRDPMCILFMGVIISQTATWASVSLFHPEIPDNKLVIDKLGKLFLFIPIAWGLQKRQKWIPVVFLAACAGFITELFITGSDYFDQIGDYFFEEVESALGGSRVDFGIRNAQHPSMVFGVMVIISIFYMAVEDKKWKKGLSFLFFAMGLAGLTATQTRQTFFGVLVAALVVFIASCILKKNSLKSMIVSAVMIGALVGAAGYSLMINHRQNEIIYNLKVLAAPLPENVKSGGRDKILSYYITKINNDSSGLRLKFWISMIPYAPQNPLLGWGGPCIKNMIEKSPLLKDVPIGKMRHLHNYFITIYLCYGIIGVLLVNGIYVWLLISGYRARQLIAHGEEWFFLSLGFVSYWMTVNFFENFNGFWTGVFCHNLVLGCFYAHFLAINEHKNEFLKISNDRTGVVADLG